MQPDNAFSVSSLGPRAIKNPLSFSNTRGDALPNYVADDEKTRWLSGSGNSGEIIEMEKAGPREKIYFNPAHVHAGIVSCGGLCPGLNDVIRALVRALWNRYGVRRVSGIRFGYKGFLPEYALPIMELTPDIVDDIHKIGGTLLGSSRGGGDRTSEIADAVERLNLNMLFTIGGDGTQKGSLAIADELERRHLKVSVVGVPKTIDNDLLYIDRSFGFETAVEKASEAVSAAHAEAHSSMNGIGLVKLMGRDSGFIAIHTALATHEVNFVLIPEVKFNLDGPNGLFVNLEKRLEKRRHAVVVVAEGAGQELVASGTKATDASGNIKMGDIGLFLKEAINRHFKEQKLEVNLKYIDPSYIIRSAPACPTDSVYCERLGTNAVHAAMAGKTRILIGMVNNEFVHLPTAVVVSKRNTVDPEGSLYRDTIDSTGQPLSLLN
ncbi:MAG: ATP-dependent 6-phosphofructokinase [Spirochaetes bacterium]|nr:ATP-dependent 6-phosphofructokinase [Spirochaetota bacterium]MBU0954023.1 ATP-dependent 6-phosphofructokinase [Spirochaetota bacterium]